MGITGQPSHRHETESTTAHANRWPHAQATDSFDFDDEKGREICRTCANRALRKRLPSVCHRHHLNSLQRSSDFKATKQPRKSTLDTSERTDYRRPRRDPSSSRRHHRCQTETSAPPQQTRRRRCRHRRQRCHSVENSRVYNRPVATLLSPSY